jgi:hypothetical protein
MRIFLFIPQFLPCHAFGANFWQRLICRKETCGEVGEGTEDFAGLNGTLFPYESS